MLSLRQLLTGVTEDDLLGFLLDVLNGLGFNATSWQSGSKAQTITRMVARMGSDLTYAIADIAASGFAGLASGPYADQLGQYMFNLTRNPALPTIGQMVLTSTPGATAHTFADGELLIADAPQGATANTFSVGTGGGTLTLAPGSSLVVTVTAAAPGSAANSVPPNSTTLQLWTPLAGVTVSNPPNPPATPSNTWITSSGADAETDGPGGRYNARMTDRWQTLGGGTEGAYEAWCRTALPSLTRVKVRSGVGDNTVHIVGATATGGLDSGDITTILNFLTGITDGISRRMINDILEIVSANSVTTPALSLTITVQSPFQADAIARVYAALETYIQSVDIGGTILQNNPTGLVLIGNLYKVVMAQQGLLNVVFALAGDIPLGQDDIYEAIPSITMLVQP